MNHWLATGDPGVRAGVRRDLGDPRRPSLSSAAVKVLLVTMYFPPAGGGGVQRPLKFATHLPELGIETHVLAPDDPKWIHRDEELPPPTLAWVHRARYIGPKGRKPAEELHGTAGLERFTRQAQLAGRRLLVPDENVSWNLTAIPAAIRIARREGIDVVITTSPPSSVHLVGAAVKQRRRHPAGSPTCATRSSRTRTGDAERLLVRVKEQGEHAVAGLVARSADAIVAVSDAIADEMRERSPSGTVVDDRERLRLRRLRRARAPRVAALPHHPRGLVLRQARPAAVPDRAARDRSRRASPASSATSALPTASGPRRSASAIGSS